MCDLVWYKGRGHPLLEPKVLVARCTWALTGQNLNALSWCSAKGVTEISLLQTTGVLPSVVSDPIFPALELTVEGAPCGLGSGKSWEQGGGGVKAGGPPKICPWRPGAAGPKGSGFLY